MASEEFDKTDLLRESLKQGGYFTIVMSILCFVGWQLHYRLIPATESYLEATSSSFESLSKSQVDLTQIVNMNHDNIVAANKILGRQQEQVDQVMKILEQATNSMKEVPAIRKRELELMETSVKTLEELVDLVREHQGAEAISPGDEPHN